MKQTIYFLIIMIATLSFSNTRSLGQNKQATTIAFFLQDGVEVLDFAGPLEVFTFAGFNVFTVSKNKQPIRSQGVLTIIPQYDLSDAPKADIIAVFGGNASAPSKDMETINWIKRQETTAMHYFSVCTGAIILGRAGLLDSLTVTTFHDQIEGLRRICPTAKVVENVRFVDNGKVITTAGISAGIDGALHLVSKIKGKSVAESVVRYMEYDKWKPGEGLIVNNSGF